MLKKKSHWMTIVYMCIINQNHKNFASITKQCMALKTED